jgi:hypothetical protein
MTGPPASVLNEPKVLRRLARKLVRGARGEVRVCYEAGPCGFVLQRQLEGSAELVCEVITPSLVPVRPGERIKTNRRNACKLVKSYGAGELTVVHPPTAGESRDSVGFTWPSARPQKRIPNNIASELNAGIHRTQTSEARLASDT